MPKYINFEGETRAEKTRFLVQFFKKFPETLFFQIFGQTGIFILILENPFAPPKERSLSLKIEKKVER